MSNNLIYQSLQQLKTKLTSAETSSRELAENFLKVKNEKSNLELFASIDEEEILRQADQSDRRRKEGKTLGPLDGIPVSIKDNICVKDAKTTCASKILENFISPYDATVITKLKENGAILFGRTNMDEFAMGSSTENSGLHPTRNPWGEDRVPGGSSGGAAASVGASVVPVSLGSDTGGSIRQPGAFCGVVGIKPTYGRISRFGLIAFASSLDQIGTFGRSVPDAAALLSAIDGYDPRDSTSHPNTSTNKIDPSVNPLNEKELKDLRVGVIFPEEEDAQFFDADILTSLNRSVEHLKSAGAKIIPLKSSYQEYMIPIYYILATAEASSNLSRYDGIRYGKRSKNPTTLMDLYVRSRTEGFGPEVKRRILLGTFVLSSGYYDAYYRTAQKARKMIQKEYSDFFTQTDVLLLPTTPTTAFRIGEKSDDPLAMYRNDILTISANLAGIPAMSIPAGLDKNGMPIGLQLQANHFNENFLFRVGRTLHEGIPGFALDYEKMASH